MTFFGMAKCRQTEELYLHVADFKFSFNERTKVFFSLEADRKTVKQKFENLQEPAWLDIKASELLQI